MQGIAGEYTTEVDDVLWSMQTLLIREAEALGSLGVPPALEAPATWIPSPEPGDPEPIRVIEAPPQPAVAIEPPPPVPVQLAPVPAPTPTPAVPESPEWARSRPAPTAPVMYDPSTGALTPHALRRELELRGSHLARSLVTVDIKPLADVRRQHGDRAADAILRVIVEAVPFALRAEDQVFRTGIDELTLLMPGAFLPDAAVLCLRVQMAVKDVLVRRELPGVILSVRPYVSAAA